MEPHMNRSVLVFKAPRVVEVRNDPLPPPADGEVTVATRRTAISPGTEMLAFKGLLPAALPLDATLVGLSHSANYPFCYGYSAVGDIVAAGPGVGKDWLGRRVFAFVPHATHFCARLEDLVPLPDHLPDEEAVCLASMETAVTLLMDGRPLVGERVAVFGQGIIGLLTTSLLAHFPLESLIAVDLYRLRREASLKAGAHVCLTPEQAAVTLAGGSGMVPAGPQGSADLVYELSGNPQTLNAALAAARFGGRVLIGSWYGSKTAEVDLGGWFHRNRIRIIGSQVSTLTPALTGRWTKARRLQTAIRMTVRVRPARFITHRFALDQAQAAYELIAGRPEETLQVIFTF
jgi:2-desacetyl-2-hydroxyethyl bacteriochlorophyllide A dehydrogenase